MQTISCPACGNPLPDSTGHCAHCGETALALEVTQHLKKQSAAQDTPAEGMSRVNIAREEGADLLEWIEAGPTARLVHKTPRELPENEPTLKLARKTSRTRQETQADPAEVTLNLRRMRQEARASLEADILTSFEEALEEPDDEVMERHTTWQKVVEPKTGHTLAAIALSSPGANIRKRFRASLWPVLRRPRAFFWLSAIVLCVLLLGGGFGIALGFGRGSSLAQTAPALALQAAPSTIALGGIVTLRGAHFTPGGQVSLSRDQRVPMVDTGGASSVRADAHGTFSDTIIVDPAWLAGPHSLYATDVHTHQQAFFKLMVTGQGVLQGPPRLLLSASELDLGAGDEATNSSKMLALSNAGGGELTWQAKTGQPWLQISPTSGSIFSGSHLSVMVVANRSGLAPGSYHTSIIFISSTEQVALSVMMKVTPLQPAHEAVLQLSSADLTFNGSAQGPLPQAQSIIMSNPGVQTLSWGASISTQDGSGWLWMTPLAGSIEPGHQQQLAIGVTTQNLAPGVYKGEISFSNQSTQPIQGNQQMIYVSLTVTPACVLAFAPGSLSFTGIHGGASPASQALSVNVAQGCTTSQRWSASVHTSSGGNWLQLSQSSAATPSTPRVSVNTTGLGPGVYSGTLTFTVNTGPQIVPVTLTVNPIPCAISTPAELTLQGTIGETSSNTNAVTVTSSGDCPHTLNWTSSVSSGATWLSATPSGTLTQPGTANLNVQAALAGLSAGTYSGTLTVTAVDSATGQTVATAQTSVILTVVQPPPPCALQIPSPSTQAITASVGSTTAQTATITLSATGACSGNVTITPSSDSSWLTTSGPLSLASSGSATLTLTIDPTSLAANTYTGTITLTAADGNGAITGSPQKVTITLTVQ